MISRSEILEDKVNVIWFWIGLLFLFAFYEFKITDVQVPTIIHDEIGYWANAAYFAGYDWSGAISQMSYFSYGIGLLLSLFMRIFKDSIVVYKVVMQFFVILLLGSYFIAYKLANELFPKISKPLIIITCIISVCYPAYIMNARIAWPENILVFLTWLIIWLFHSYIKKPHIIKIFLVAIMLGYLYMCHQRTIGMIFLTVLCVVFMTVKHQIRKRDFFFFLVFLIAIFGIHIFIKLNIQQNLWYRGNRTEVMVTNNDYAERLNSLIYTLSNYGIKPFVVSFVGKVYYIIVASFGLLAESFLFFVTNMGRIWQGKNISIRTYTILFIYILVIGAVGLNVVATASLGGRIDGLIYGRYMEHTFGPAIMLGILSIVEKEKKLRFRHMLLLNAFTLILSILVFNIYNTYKWERYLGVCAVSTCWAYENVGEKTFVFFCALLSVFVYTFFTLLGKVGKEKIALGIILICFLINGVYARNTMYGIERNNKNMIEVADMIKQFNTKLDVYAIRGDDPNMYLYLEVLQYILPDYKMSFIQEEDLDALEGEYVLFTEEIKYIFLQHNKYIFDIFNGWKMFVPNNGALYEEIIQKER